LLNLNISYMLVQIFHIIENKIKLPYKSTLMKTLKIY